METISDNRNRANNVFTKSDRQVGIEHAHLAVVSPCVANENDGNVVH